MLWTVDAAGRNWFCLLCGRSLQFRYCWCLINIRRLGLNSQSGTLHEWHLIRFTLGLVSALRIWALISSILSYQCVHCRFFCLGRYEKSSHGFFDASEVVIGLKLRLFWLRLGILCNWCSTKWCYTTAFRSFTYLKWFLYHINTVIS